MRRNYPSTDNSMDNEPMMPEQRILVAVIQQALKDALVRPTFRPMPKSYLPYRQERWHKARKNALMVWRLERQKALHWLLEENDEQRVMSLGWCCTMLDTDIESIRKRVRATMGVDADTSERYDFLYKPQVLHPHSRVFV